MLAQQPPGGLMELPFATQQVEVTGQRMLYQTVHGKPIMAGYLSRRYDSPIINSCSPFWGFISPLDVPKEDIASPLVVNRPQDALSFYGINNIALYNNSGGPEADTVDPDLKVALEGIVSDVAPGTPLYSDDYISLHKVAPASLDSAPLSFHIGPGWYNIEQSDGTPFRWAKDGNGTLCLFAPHPATTPLTLEATAFAHDRPISITAGDKGIFSGTVPAGKFLSIKTDPIDWQPGVTEIHITSDSRAPPPYRSTPRPKISAPLPSA